MHELAGVGEGGGGRGCIFIIHDIDCVFYKVTGTRDSSAITTWLRNVKSHLISCEDSAAFPWSLVTTKQRNSGENTKLGRVYNIYQV